MNNEEIIMKGIAINRRIIAAILKLHLNFTDDDIDTVFTEVSKEVDDMYKKYFNKNNESEDKK